MPDDGQNHDVIGALMYSEEKRAKAVDSILDGWFGEPLEHSENEDQLRKHLYDPLRKLVETTYLLGYHDGYYEGDENARNEDGVQF